MTRAAAAQRTAWARALSTGWMLASREWLADARQSRLGIVWPLLYPLGYTALLMLFRPVLPAPGEAPHRFAVFVLVGFSLWQTWIDVLRLQLGAIRRYRGLVSRGELDSAALLATSALTAGLQLAPRLAMLVIVVVAVPGMDPAALAGLVAFSAVILLNGAVIGALLQPFATLSPGIDRVVQGLSLALLITGGVFVPMPRDPAPLLAAVMAANPMGVLLDAARAPLFGEPIAAGAWVGAWTLATLAGALAWPLLGRRLLPIVTERLGN